MQNAPFSMQKAPCFGISVKEPEFYLNKVVNRRFAFPHFKARVALLDDLAASMG
jgi:hypothetical protein